ncbi:MAG TPA: hypothetical protein VH815_11110, partial [Acidobacteriota bacterium]
MKKLYLVYFFLCVTTALHAQTSLKFEISFPKEIGEQPQDGRLLLLLSTDDSEEPRAQITDSLKTQQVFGTDVEAWKPGEVKVI